MKLLALLTAIAGNNNIMTNLGTVGTCRTQTQTSKFYFPVRPRPYKDCLIPDLGQGKDRMLEGKEYEKRTEMMSKGFRSLFEDVLTIQRRRKIPSNDKAAMDCMKPC